MRVPNEFTPQQRAAIYLHVLENFDDWSILFKIAEGETRYNNLTDSSKRQTVSKWKLSEKINQAIYEIKYILKKEEDRVRQEGRSERETEPKENEIKGLENTDINFLDPDQFLQFANKQANKIKDEKERRAYLEMIAKLMNYKDKEESENEQIRAYLPVVCDSCECYKRCLSCKLSICTSESD